MKTDRSDNNISKQGETTAMAGRLRLQANGPAAVVLVVLFALTCMMHGGLSWADLSDGTSSIFRY
ncbi:hypothetical protein D3W54_00540 [Komagataeibacter medellinensis]|uniref:Uncharacterized protein n=1 Tax=Komagataeibacter medellinensis TaxID=1177712 RepID=A0ABQ6VQU8_9PROT|nr:hypothetical protein [Komagataeibacter medellinensis]KAB8122329.1 hypothetical protein D3W54_14010 [Komagataeibacter medellinensis]KAB8122976.1 hypothetical protein D3W54_00540 [Komagataeibacter medellinensis]